MLIDIEKYVRQLLPPNRRGDDHVGLMTTLFKPIDAVINRMNELEYDSQFDAYGGQVGVIEFVLQNYVDSNIRILDADGVRLDFRVLVPDGISDAKMGLVRKYLDRLRVASKRYEITSTPQWSNGGGGIGLAWEIAPEVVQGLEIRFKPSIPGVYYTLIYRQDAQEVYLAENVEYPNNFTPHYTLPSAGIWRIELASLVGTVDLTPVTVTTTTPDWLEWLGITWSQNTKECSIWIDTLDDVDVEIKINAVDGSALSGITWGGIPFDNNSYIAGTTEWAGARSEVFRINPPVGLQPGTEYRLFIRRTAYPNTIFSINMVTPTSDIDSPSAIVLPTTGVGVTCGNPPTVAAIHLHTQQRVTFTFAGADITDIKAQLKNTATGVIVRSKDIQVATPNGSGGYNAVFSPGNRPTWVYSTPIPAGTYQLGIEGGNCDSSVSWSASFTVTEDEVIDPGGPLDPQSGDYAVFQQVVPYPGFMKMQRTAITGGWLYTDLRLKGDTGADSALVMWYEINGVRIITDRLVDYFVSDKNQAISIVKSPQKSTTDDWWQVDHNQGGNDANQGYFYPGFIYAVRLTDVFIKQ